MDDDVPVFVFEEGVAGLVDFDSLDELDDFVEVQVYPNNANVFVELNQRNDVGNHVGVDVLVLVGQQPRGLAYLGGEVVPADVLDVVAVVEGDVGGVVCDGQDVVFAVM